MAFIFFYEARGRRLIGAGREEEPAAGIMLQRQFRQQIAMGTFVLVLGAVLILALRRRHRQDPFPALELVAYALAVGLLVGTAVVSWARVFGSAP
ncbi:MAG: hypothetical protein NTW87_33085 [Planctomycetota bacterium]|nr:hypothetical protein [Planctomycetota bacterium]